MCRQLRTMESRALLTNESSSCKEVPNGELISGRRGGCDRQPGGRDARRAREQRSASVGRHGSEPAGRARISHVAADAADAGAMARLAEGVSVIYNCVNPPYHRWPADWPPIAASVLAAATSGAVWSRLSNLYGYGPGRYDEAHPMTGPRRWPRRAARGGVRARVWQDALAADQAGRVRVAEVRAPISSGRAQSALGERIVRRVRQGKGVSVPARLPAAHLVVHRRRGQDAGRRRKPTPGPGGVPGTCRRTSRAASVRSSTTSPGRRGRSGPRRRDPLGRPERNGTLLTAPARGARDRVPVPRRLRHGLLGRSGCLRPEARGAVGGDRRRDG